jgi:hypothetical protein
MLTDAQRNERVIKYLNKEVELFVNYVNEVLKMKFHLDPEPFDYEGTSPWGIMFDDIYIAANEDLDKFEVGYGTYDPGGYWKPPSGDYVEYSNRKKIQDALFDALKIYMEWDYRGYLESQWAAEVVSELEE